MSTDLCSETWFAKPYSDATTTWHLFQDLMLMTAVQPTHLSRGREKLLLKNAYHKSHIDDRTL